jgi:hypothetical protein
MKHMKGLMVAAAVVSCGALASAQHLAAPAVSSAPATVQQSATAAPTPDTSACAFSFTNAGPQNQFLRYCVTVNGNIVSFVSPNGFDQIAQGTIGEGYGICDTSTGVRYFDYSDFGDSGNWGGSVILASTATSVKITRTTADGAWTLIQTITKVGGASPSAKVTMALKNNSATRKEAVLVRYADVDPSDASSNGFGETFDSSQFSAWGYLPANSGRTSIGLKITQLGNIAPASIPWGFVGLDQNTPAGPDPCNPGGAYAGLVTGTDGSTVMEWVMILNAHQQGTVNSKYEMF